jgi:hypothetical protein
MSRNTIVVLTFGSNIPPGCRSQWLRGVRHELFSLARMLGWWVRIPLKAWMSVYVYSLFVLSCVQVEALRRADPSSKDSYHLCKKDYETEEEAKD